MPALVQALSLWPGSVHVYCVIVLAQTMSRCSVQAPHGLSLWPGSVHVYCKSCIAYYVTHCCSVQAQLCLSLWPGSVHMCVLCMDRILRKYVHDCGAPRWMVRCPHAGLLITYQPAKGGCRLGLHCACVLAIVAGPTASLPYFWGQLYSYSYSCKE